MRRIILFLSRLWPFSEFCVKNQRLKLMIEIQRFQRLTPKMAKVEQRGRSLIAALTSRPLFTSPARVMVLFAVSASCRNIWSGPEDRHCKVHNGLTLITRPSPRRAIACTLALGRCVLAYLTSFDELRCHGRRGPAERLARSPDTVQDHGQLARQGYSGLA